MYGRPGACYVDIAGDMVNAKVDRSKVRFVASFSVGVFDFGCADCDTRMFLLQTCVLLSSSTCELGRP